MSALIHILLSEIRGAVRLGRIILPVLLMSVALPSFARAKKELVPNEYDLTIEHSVLAKAANNVVVLLQITAKENVPPMQSIVVIPVLEDTVNHHEIHFPEIFINSRNQQIYFDRYLYGDYPNAVAMRKRKGVDLSFDYLRSVKYEPWMANAVLKLRKQTCACSNPKDKSEVIIASLSGDEVPVINLYPVYLLPPADKRMKVREEQGSAFLCFELDKTEIKPNFMTNPIELQKIFNSMNLVKNDSDVTVSRLMIDGYASPDGPEKHNLELSEQRTEALKEYLEKANIHTGVRIDAKGHGENWDDLKEYLQNNTNIPQRNKLINITNNSRTADEKERQMRTEASEGFAFLLENVFPLLRCTKYRVIYTVRPFTIEESERVFETHPVNLSLNEIYRLADKYADEQERYYSIMRTAYLLYPDDSFINLTMSCLAIIRGEADVAADHLKKVDDCPEKSMNEGLVAYLKGDLNKAVMLVERARRYGVVGADKQLEEFEKLSLPK